MQLALIDSASISQLVQFLDRGTSGQYPWSVQEAIDLTALAIRERNLTVAPGLTGPKGVARDPLDTMLDAMLRSRIVRFHSEVSDDDKRRAFSRSTRWLARPEVITKIRLEVKRLHDDAENYQHWIDWAARNAWESHSRRLGGLLDEQYEPYVARVLELDAPRAAALRHRSLKVNELNELINSRSEDFDLMSRAYLASSIMRGRYHEELAAAAQYQLKRHPLRAMLSRARAGSVAYTVTVPPAAWCLACLILYGAVRQSSLAARIDCWVANMTKVCGFFDRGGLRFAEGSDAAAMDSALVVARQAGVEIVDRRFDTISEIALGLGIGALTSLYLSPWLGIPAGVAARTTVKKLGFPSKFRNSIAYDTGDHTLRDVMSGRIDSHWTRNS